MEKRNSSLAATGTCPSDQMNHILPVCLSLCLSVFLFVTHCNAPCRFYYLDILNMMLEAEGELRTHTRTHMYIHEICASTKISANA